MNKYYNNSFIYNLQMAFRFEVLDKGSSSHVYRLSFLILPSHALPHALQELVQLVVFREPAVGKNRLGRYLPSRVQLEQALEEGLRALNFLQGPAHHRKALFREADSKRGEAVALDALGAALPGIGEWHT
jgi:hypothetical protein